MRTKSPLHAKRLGDKVKNFNPQVWQLVRYDIMKIANRLKFSNNPTLAEMILQTANTTLVHAQPYDCHWGTGLSIYATCIKPISEWPGLNHLGHILQHIRYDIFHKLHTTRTYTQHSLQSFFSSYHREGFTTPPTPCTDLHT